MRRILLSYYLCGARHTRDAIWKSRDRSIIC